MPRELKILSRSFYARDTLLVTRDLLGMLIVHDSPEGRTVGRIVEAEAYVGEEDAACHAAAGLTARTHPLYGPPGHAYVYFVYGMHWCFNVVTRRTGRPSAVLIRAVEPAQGVELMRARRSGRADRELTNGPGKLVRALGIGPQHNRIDLTRGALTVRRGASVPPREVTWAPRVGIREAVDRPYRAYVKGSLYVSRPR